MRKLICTAISDLLPIVSSLVFVTALSLNFCIGCIGKESNEEQNIHKIVAHTVDRSKTGRLIAEDMREAIRSGEFQFSVAEESSTEK